MTVNSTTTQQFNTRNSADLLAAQDKEQRILRLQEELKRLSLYESECEKKESLIQSLNGQISELQVRKENVQQDIDPVQSIPCQSWDHHKFIQENRGPTPKISLRLKTLTLLIHAKYLANKTLNRTLASKCSHHMFRLLFTVSEFNADETATV